MSPARVTAQPAPKTEWLSIFQFAASALGMAVFLTTSFGSLVLAFTSFLSGQQGDVGNLVLISFGALWIALLLLPSCVYSFARITGRTVRPIAEGPRWLVLRRLGFTLYPLLILLGWFLSRSNLGLLLAPLHIAVASITTGFLLWLGIRNLNIGSPQLRWGAFASGLTLAPLAAITLEVLTGIFLFVITSFYIAIRPELTQALVDLQRNAQFVQDPALLIQHLHVFLSDPLVLGLVLANFALFVPLIEELIKPIAVWAVIWGRQLTPAQGFGLGLLSGAGFALLENLFSGATTVGWAETASIRIGATAFHIVTSGLMGWALVRAKEQGRYLGVFAVYAFNILLHAAWNGVVVLTALAELGGSGAGGFLPFAVPDSATLILLFVTLLSVSILLMLNRRLQPAAAPAKAVPARKRAAAKPRARRTPTKTRS